MYIMYENTITRIDNKKVPASFHFNEMVKDVLTKSEKSNKPTTVKVEGVILSTLNINNYAEILSFLTEIGLIKEESEAPEWMEGLNMFDDSNQLKIIQENNMVIEMANENISNAMEVINQNKRYKSVLYTSGDELVEVIFEILENMLGCDLSEFTDKKKEDFKFKLNDKVFIGEIKGVTPNVKKSNVSQLDVHVQEYLDDNDEESKNIVALLIINHQRSKPISARELPQLIPCAVRMIMTLVSSLAGNLPKLIQSGLKLMKGLASGIANSIPIVAAKAPIIIGKLASTIITNLPKILTAGVQIVSKLAVGLVRGIPALIGKIPSMVSQIRNAFTSVNWGSVGMNIVKGIASGLANAGGVIVKAAKSAAKSALDAAKSALGIHSPSRVFRDQVGKMMALGMGIGFEKNIPLKSMNVGVQRAVSGLQKSVDLALSARTVDKTVGRVKSYPGFDGGKDIDYDRLERIQMKAADKLSKRPIYLGTKRIDEPLPKGAVPVW